MAIFAKVCLALAFGRSAATSEDGLVSLVQSTVQAHGADEWSPTMVSGLADKHRKLKNHYAPTEMKVEEGVWVPCFIHGKGLRPGSYNVEVRPENFASYNLTGVPAEVLKKVRVIRDFLPVELERPAVSNVEASAEEKSEVSSEIHLAVVDDTGYEMKFKMLARSPMRTLMRMACQYSGFSWSRCQRHVTFTWKDGEVDEASHAAELGMTDGDMLKMVVS